MSCDQKCIIRGKSKGIDTTFIAKVPFVKLVKMKVSRPRNFGRDLRWHGDLSLLTYKFSQSSEG